MNLSGLNLILIIVSALLNSASFLIIKSKLNQFNLTFNSINSINSSIALLLKSPAIWIAGIMFVIAPFVFLIALAKTNVTIAYPILVGLNFVIVIFLSVLFLNENINLTKIIGIVLIFISIYLLNK